MPEATGAAVQGMATPGFRGPPGDKSGRHNAISIQEVLQILATYNGASNDGGVASSSAACMGGAAAAVDEGKRKLPWPAAHAWMHELQHGTALNSERHIAAVDARGGSGGGDGGANVDPGGLDQLLGAAALMERSTDVRVPQTQTQTLFLPQPIICQVCCFEEATEGCYHPCACIQYPLVCLDGIDGLAPLLSLPLPFKPSFPPTVLTFHSCYPCRYPTASLTCIV